MENMHIDITVLQRSITMHTSSFAFTVFMKGNMHVTYTEVGQLFDSYELISITIGS